jgi:hypothetical protein
VPDIPRMPPRFVPTLTEVVGAATGTQVVPAAAVRSVERSVPVVEAPLASPSVQGRPAAGGLEEEIMHAVMQRVDALLEQRLQAVVAASVETQLPLIAARLRSGVETALRRTVADALADELQRRTGGPV